MLQQAVSEDQNTGWIRQYSPALRASLSLRPCIISSSSLRTRSASCWSLCSPSCLMRWTNSEGSNSSVADMMMKNTSDPGTTLRRAGETMERRSSKAFKAKQSPLYRHFFGYLILSQASTVSGVTHGGNAARNSTCTVQYSHSSPLVYMALFNSL